MKLCPRCASEITSKMKKCDRCGLPLDKVNFSDEVEEVSKTEQNAEQAPENKSESGKEKRARLKAEKKAKKLAKKQAIKEKRERESVSDTDFSKYATNAAASETDDEEELMRRGLFGTKKVSNKKNKQAKPVFELDETGDQTF